VDGPHADDAHGFFVAGFAEETLAGGDPLAAKNLGLFLIEQGRPKAAERALQRAREMGRPAPEKQVLASRQYAQRKAVTEAFDRARQTKRTDARWRSIAELQRTGSKTVLDLALNALRSRQRGDRALGAYVLSQLGFESSTPPFREQSVRALRAALKTERSPQPLAAIAFALCRLWSRRSIPDLVRLAIHRDPNVRQVLAAELIHTTRELGWGDETADRRVTAALLNLTRDRVPEVRDWACYSLGNSEQDSPEIRQAFIDRLRDRHFDALVEAVAALGRRNDSRAIEPLLQILNKHGWRLGTWVTTDLVVFAGHSNDRRFIPYLIDFRDRWQPQPDEKQAIRNALSQLRGVRP
jgi:HEAT repeat protein